MLKLKRDFPMDTWYIRIMEHEKGVKFGPLGGTTILDPGEHFRLRNWTKVVAVDLREQNLNQTYAVATKDRSGFDATIDLRYKVFFPDTFSVDAPENLEDRLSTLVGAEANRYSQEQFTASDIRSHREPMATSIQALMHQTGLSWGLEVIKTTVANIVHTGTPHNATPLEASQYTLAIHQLMAPIRAQLEAQVGVIQARGEADADIIRGKAKIEILQRFGQVLGEMGTSLARDFGPEQGSNILYAVMAQLQGTGLLQQRFSTLFRIDTQNEAAKRTGQALGVNPAYARVYNDLSQMAETLAGSKQTSSLKDIDKDIHDQYFTGGRKVG